MKIRLFSDRLIKEESCFQLHRAGVADGVDLPVPIGREPDAPFHIVHSDPDHLAYLVGLIVLQAWAFGLDESETPLPQRRPVLVATSRPGRFAEAYLRLNLSSKPFRQYCIRRRITFFEKSIPLPLGNKDKSGYWDSFITEDDQRSLLHNFFPAYNVLKADSNPIVISGRQSLGRGDEEGPALIITKKPDTSALRLLIKRYSPLLAIFDRCDAPTTDVKIPKVIYHESIFSPTIAREGIEPGAVTCLPDARFEHFCSRANLTLIEPLESEDLASVWDDVDSAFQALIERLNQRRHPVIIEVYRNVYRLRNLLLSLPVGIQSYETALRVSGLPQSLWHDWSVSELLQALENRIPEIAALGEWEELILQELVNGFRQIESRLHQYSPKRESLLGAVKESLSQSRRVVLAVNGSSFAKGLKWVAQLPEPLGLGLPPDRVTTLTPEDVRTLEPDQDCIIHQVIDPQDIFSSLAKAGPRRLTFVLSRNELRFVGEQFFRLRRLFPDHKAHEKLLRPIYQQLERLRPVERMSRPDRHLTLFSDADFDLIKQMFGDGANTLDHGRVLVDTPSHPDENPAAEVKAYLVKLEGEKAVFLDTTVRVSYVSQDDNIVSGAPDSLEPGHRLIILNPAARESIAHRILITKRDEEMDQVIGQTIRKWQQELAAGIDRLGFSHAEVLQKIRELGSQRMASVVIGQWARGDVLGPQDPQDIRRVGLAIGSDWLIENWQRVGTALLILRKGHRLLGRQTTHIIQRAAVGDFELSRQDEEFLEQIGVTVGELQDAVTLLTVEAVSDDAKTVPINQLGQVVTI
jgi:hypothetical protein